MITISKLAKSFRVYTRRSARLRAIFGKAVEGRDFELVKSLSGITLSVPSGSVHGLIGMNGAGKSTLLKILTGVIEPTSGSFELSGRVAALLELGTGFHPEMTGRQNIETNAGLLGFSKAEIRAKIEAIANFAELGAFFDRPVKIYSSGMYVRLAFSFAIAVEPDILIIDEALSVGDAYFQQKCLEEIYRFKKKGTTILFVSHDLQAIKLLCDQVSLLSMGEVLYTGPAIDAMERYNALLSHHKDPHRDRLDKLETLQNPGSLGLNSGSQEIRIIKIFLKDNQGQPCEAVVASDTITIEVETEVTTPSLENPTCGILIRDRLGYDVFGTNSSYLGMQTGNFQKGDRPCFCFTMALNLGPGDYTLTVALHASATHLEKNYDWRDRALLLRVLPSTGFQSIGVARLFPTLSVTRL